MIYNNYILSICVPFHTKYAMTKDAEIQQVPPGFCLFRGRYSNLQEDNSKSSAGKKNNDVSRIGFDFSIFSLYVFCCYMGMGQNLVPLVNIKIAGKWMFIPLKMVLIGIDP
jgi:hypothetical protein